MNMALHCRCLALFVFALLTSGCDDATLNPEDLGASLPVSQAHKLIWTLDKSGYEPFNLIFNREQFFGDDGCNAFGGSYETRNDSIFPGQVSQTLKLCDVKGFPILHLTQPYRIHVASGVLLLFTQQGLFAYKSAVTDSIKDSPVLGNWVLHTSTEPEFSYIQRQALIPKLTVDATRQFKIEWYCVPENPFGCDEISGLFGLGGARIKFYKTGWKNHGDGLGFVERILGCTEYTVESDSLNDESLRLVNPSSGTEFQFFRE